MTSPLQFGLDTFGDVTKDGTGKTLAHAQVIRNVVDEAVLADELGLDFIGLGEHHRSDFAISSPETVLAAIASRTRRIHLGSAVTVLSSDDPIRVFQRFATAAPRSSSAADPSPNPFRCSASTCALTRRCSRRSSTCSRHSCRSSR
jgi:hypothetical protein